MPESKRRVYIGLAVIGSVAATFVGLGYHLQTKLAVVTHDPRVALVPTMRPANEPDFPLREIDLGYLTVSLPAVIVGEPKGVHGSTAVQIESQHESSGVAILPPVDLDDPERNDLVQQFTKMGAIAKPDWYELKKTFLYAEPFDLWDVPSIGFDEARIRLLLLLAKNLEVGSASRVRLVETDRLDLVVLTHDEGNMIQIIDRSHESLQTILIDDMDDLAEQVIDAVAATYALQTDDLSTQAIKGRLHQAGIEFPPPPDDQLDTLTDEEVQSRMNRVAEEIRRRRTEPQAPVRSVLVPAEDN